MHERDRAWFNSNGMTIQVSKTVLMLFGRRQENKDAFQPVVLYTKIKLLCKLIRIKL